jgi:hypothetical protein
MLTRTQDDEQIIERVAALDIGKAELVCCIRIPDEDHPGRRLQEVDSYPTMTRARSAGIRHVASSIRASVIVGLMMLAAVACAASGAAARPSPGAGCHALPGGRPAPGPVPRKVALRLPAGMFYVLAGPNDSLNLWQVSNSGCERQLTYIRRFGVSDFGASRASVILSVAPTGVSQLARLGPHGPVLLPDGAVSTVGIDPVGRVVYIRSPTGPGRKNVFQVVVKKSYRSPPHVIYQQKATLIVCEWGPKRHIVTISAADANEHGPMRLLDIGPKGQVQEVRTGVPNVGNAFWGKKAPGIAIIAGRSGELVRPDGTIQRLPQGWHPGAWNPAGTELLVWATGDRALGVWNPDEPAHVERIGLLPSKVRFAKIAWLAKPAKTRRQPRTTIDDTAPVPNSGCTSAHRGRGHLPPRPRRLGGRHRPRRPVHLAARPPAPVQRPQGQMRHLPLPQPRRPAAPRRHRDHRDQRHRAHPAAARLRQRAQAPPQDVNRAVRVWDLASGEEAARWSRDSGILTCIALPGKTLKIAVGQKRGQPYLLELRGQRNAT